MDAEASTEQSVVTYKANRDDYNRYYNRAFLARIRKPVSIIRSLAFATIISWFIYYNASLTGTNPLDAVVIFFCYLIGINGLVYWQFRATSAIAANRSLELPGERRASISPDYLINESQGGASKLPWSAITSIDEDDELIYISLKSNTPNFLPKRSFSSVTACEKFYANLRDVWKRQVKQPILVHQTNSANNQTVKISFQHSLTSLIAANRIAIPLSGQPAIRQKSLTMIFAMPLIFCLVLEGRSIFLGKHWPILLPYLLAAIVPVASALRISTLKYVSRQALKQPDFNHRWTVVADAESLTIHTLSSISLFSWKRLSSVTTQHDGVVIMFEPSSSLFIPSTAFRSDDELNQYVEAINRLSNGLSVSAQALRLFTKADIWPPPPISLTTS